MAARSFQPANTAPFSGVKLKGTPKHRAAFSGVKLKVPPKHTAAFSGVKLKPTPKHTEAIQRVPRRSPHAYASLKTYILFNYEKSKYFRTKSST